MKMFKWADTGSAVPSSLTWHLRVGRIERRETDLVKCTKNSKQQSLSPVLGRNNKGTQLSPGTCPFQQALLGLLLSTLLSYLAGPLCRAAAASSRPTKWLSLPAALGKRQLLPPRGSGT